MIGHPLDSVPGRAYSSGNDCPVYAEIVGVNRKATCCTNRPVRHVLRTRHVPVLLRQAGKCTCARKATPAPTVPRARPGDALCPGKLELMVVLDMSGSVSRVIYGGGSTSD